MQSYCDGESLSESSIIGGNEMAKPGLPIRAFTKKNSDPISDEFSTTKALSKNYITVAAHVIR